MRWMAGLRLAAVIAAAAALIDAAPLLPARGRTLILAFDLSDSIGRENVEAARGAALGLLTGLSRRDKVAVVAFAGKPAVVTAPIAPERARSLLEAAYLNAPLAGETDLAAGIATAVSLAGRGGGDRSIVLFSDGRTNAGSPLPSGAASRAGIPVHVVPIGRAEGGVAARGLSLPELVRPGESVLARWKLDSDLPREIEYSVKVDGAVASRARASLVAGMNDIPLTIAAGQAGARLVEVEARDAEGRPIAEAASGGLLSVGGEARILVIRGERPSPISAALRAQGMTLRDAGVEGLPESASGYAGYSAVVLDDVPALAMTESQQSGLQDFVTGGGGLLVVGGDSSLGRGEYYATPLEELLPVATDTRQRLFFTRAKLLFVIDHSGSMSEQVGETSKQLAAMQGVAAAIPELNPMDEVGILSFDSSPTWILPFTPASKRETITASLSNLGEGGGTDMSQAIEEVIKGFGNPEPTKRHAVILTDGLTPGADFRRLATRLSSIGVTISTIGVGKEVNEDLLRNFAQWTGGTYYRAELDQIPKIINKETVKMTRDLIQEGPIATRVKSPSPIVEGLGSPLPPVSGYLLTQAKSLATVYIEAGSLRSPDKWDPLLAAWRYGNGRVAVFAADSGARWLSAWSGTAAYNRLWSQVVRTVERQGPDKGLRSSAIIEGRNAHFIVEAIGPDGRSVAGLHLVGRGSGRGAEPFGLKETAPGRYEGFAPLEGSGIHGFEMLDPRSGAWTSAWVWNPPGAEMATRGPDQGSLGLVAEDSGGRVLSLDRLALPTTILRWARTPLRRPLLVLALLLLVAELYVRSTMLGQLSQARKAIAAWWAGQSAAAEALRLPRRRPSPDPVRSDPERELLAQRRLAEHVSKRSAKTEKAEAEGKEA
jgi:Ca-activated chloride channel family protein